MEENILKIFARSVTRYFDTVADGGAILGAPYLGSDGESLGLGYSAVIGISGAYRGNIYYTAPRAKLNALLPHLGETRPDETLCASLVGEIANTISGNAREELGRGFMISTPFVLEGRDIAVRPAKGSPCYILPIIWRDHPSRVLVSLHKSPENP